MSTATGAIFGTVQTSRLHTTSTSVLPFGGQRVFFPRYDCVVKAASFWICEHPVRTLRRCNRHNNILYISNYVKSHLYILYIYVYLIQMPAAMFAVIEAAHGLYYYILTRRTALASRIIIRSSLTAPPLPSSDVTSRRDRKHIIVICYY